MTLFHKLYHVDTISLVISLFLLVFRGKTAFIWKYMQDKFTIYGHKNAFLLQKTATNNEITTEMTSRGYILKNKLLLRRFQAIKICGKISKIFNLFFKFNAEINAFLVRKTLK